MLNAVVHIDLPSVETNRRMGPLEWVRSLFGATIDLRSGKEAITISGLSLVEGMVNGLRAAHITDVISLLVDRKVIYADTKEVSGDLPLMMQAAETSGLLDRPFKQMHLVLSRHEAGLHVLLDIHVASEVVLGGEEMTVGLTGRIESLRVEPGESAADYAERVRAVATAPDGLESSRAAFDALAGRVADALRHTLVGSKVRLEPARVQVLRPEAAQIARFRQLPFGADTAQPHYRAVPSTRRTGYYDNPFHYYYYDPYYDYTNWVLYDAMLHHHAWSAPYVDVVAPSGAPVWSGESGAALSTVAGSPAAGWGGADAVSFDATGNLCIDPSIPESTAPTASFLAGESSSSDSGSGWGAADSSSSSSDSGWGGGDSSSSSSCSSSSSSCSSSSSSCSSSSSSCSSSSSSCSSSSSSCSSSSSSCSSSSSSCSSSS